MGESLSIVHHRRGTEEIVSLTICGPKVHQVKAVIRTLALFKQNITQIMLLYIEKRIGIKFLEYKKLV